MKTGLVAVL